jgi:capsular polysaccharide biosynthesis protein
MDFGLFAGVLWRSRLVVLAGLLIACAAAVFAMARVEIQGGHPRLVYRDPVVYQSTVQMLVSQPGFPEGRSVFNTTPITLPSGRVDNPTFADPSRFTELASLYSQLIMGNVEAERVFGSLKPPRYEAIIASPMAAPGGNGAVLPVIQITGVAPSPTKAVALADRAATSFSKYLAERQNATGVTESDRVIIDRFAGPLRPTVYLPRKKTRSIFAFVLILMLTVTVVFIREKARNRRAAEANEEEISGVEQLLNHQTEPLDSRKLGSLPGSTQDSTALAQTGDY